VLLWWLLVICLLMRATYMYDPVESEEGLVHRVCANSFIITFCKKILLSFSPTCQFWKCGLQAQAIMALAGSNGRSWCTTYSPRPTASVPDSTASEDSWMRLEKNKDQAAGKSLSGGSLSLCSEVQTLLRGLAKSGIGKARPL
jgi:hypothetical protein